MYKTLSRKN